MWPKIYHLKCIILSFHFLKHLLRHLISVPVQLKPTLPAFLHLLRLIPVGIQIQGPQITWRMPFLFLRWPYNIEDQIKYMWGMAPFLLSAPRLSLHLINLFIWIACYILLVLLKIFSPCSSLPRKTRCILSFMLCIVSLKTMYLIRYWFMVLM